MDETTQLKLPLLQASQAQKHVTVNAALMRLDGLAQLRLQSASTTTPPGAVVDGECWFVPSGAVNAWAGQGGQVAIGDNGGWVFVAPQVGWRAWIIDTATDALWDGSAWQPPLMAASPSGAASKMQVLEFDHVIAAGSSDTTAVQVPANAMVFAVSARVITAITGTLSSWTFGISGSESQFGSGLGLGQGSYCTGLLGAPTTWYSANALKLTATGGDFAGGEIRVAAHFFSIDLPNL
ncbi:DUF2793 domain-containing protein [Oceanicola sp. 502str15]|uniref:DUF2793 domain-containing protein n=1 Tax=Oceanicola sp. 502str15 TaxID=2696061 RepID=UPI0020947E2E|nr:DUF2793 domain-containing protein [Oceanicola sp. 502str15]MCO6381891.1 DUF2793 domain-containing protein [Oceanicola sp. 502str15]